MGLVLPEGIKLWVVLVFWNPTGRIDWNDEAILKTPKTNTYGKNKPPLLRIASRYSNRERRSGTSFRLETDRRQVKTPPDDLPPHLRERLRLRMTGSIVHPRPPSSNITLLPTSLRHSFHFPVGIDNRHDTYPALHVSRYVLFRLGRTPNP